MTLVANYAELPGTRREALLLLLAAAFIWVNALSLGLVRVGRIDPVRFLAPIAWSFMMLLGHLLLTRYKPGRDPTLLPIYGLLTGWGLVLIDRLALDFLPRQTLWLALGTATLLAVAILPRNLRSLRRYRYTWLTLGLLLLAATFVFGVNPAGFGLTLWLPLPFIGDVFFQPSELLKLVLVIFLASYFGEREPLLQRSAANGRRSSLAYLAPLLLMWGFCLILLVWQRDLGAATLFFMVFMTLLYLATGERFYALAGLALLLLAGVIGYFAFDVVALRVDAWWNPWPDAGDRAYQIVQSLYALAAGGIMGRGIGLGSPTFVPVVHSDFIFAAIAEEWGLIGTLSVVAAFAFLGYRGFRISLLTGRPFRRYLAAGISVMLGAQSLLIMGGVTKLLPLTGVTLPFLSYGGSSLLVSSAMMGLLLYLSSDQDERWQQ